MRDIELKILNKIIILIVIKIPLLRIYEIINIVSTNKELLFLITAANSKNSHVNEIVYFEQIIVRRIDFYLKLHSAFLKRTHAERIQNQVILLIQRIRNEVYCPL